MNVGTSQQTQFPSQAQTALQSLLPGLTSLPAPGQGTQCITGVVNISQCFAPLQPGGVIGQITTPFGGQIPLIQTTPAPLGAVSLAAVNGQFATLCGRFTVRSGQTVFDVSLVLPGAQQPGVPFDNRLLLLLLLLLLGQGGGIPFLGLQPGLFGALGVQGVQGGLISTLAAQRQS